MSSVGARWCRLVSISSGSGVLWGPVIMGKNQMAQMNGLAQKSPGITILAICPLPGGVGGWLTRFKHPRTKSPSKSDFPILVF